MLNKKPPTTKTVWAVLIPLMPSLMYVSTASPKQPNVVFIFADDQGFSDIGYRDRNISTPNLDGLASSGVKLDNYYVQPVCSPSRSQMMTGQYQIHMGTQHRIFRPSQPFGLPLEFSTIADVLRKERYSTHAVGKWHLGSHKKAFFPTNRGFDSFYGILQGGSDHYHYNNSDTYRNVTIEEKRDGVEIWNGYNLYENDQPSFEGNGTYSTHLYTERAIRVIQNSSKSDKPLFLYLCYQSPHAPLQVPDSYMDSNIKNQPRRIYTGMIKALDEGIGNITKALKEVGLWNNTILIYSSDNGGRPSLGANNAPLRGAKASLWEGGMRAVGFVASPLLQKHRKGTVSHQMMHVSDWFPTIADMAGVDVTKDDFKRLDGISQWPMIKDGLASKRSEILHNIDILTPLQGSRKYSDKFDTRVRAALRVGDLKIITGDPGDDTWYQVPDNDDVLQLPPMYAEFSATAKNVWLFNITQDPNERKDLSEAMPDKVKELLDKLSAYNDTTRKPWFPPSDPASDPALHGGIWVPWLD